MIIIWNLWGKRLNYYRENTCSASSKSIILKNAIIAVLLKYLSIFGGLFKVPLINCKVELKRK